MSKRGGPRKKARPDDARGGLRTTTRADAKPAGGRKTKWRSVFHTDVQAALSVMGAADAVQARLRQDEAEIALVERLILEERERRLNDPASAGQGETTMSYRCIHCGGHTGDTMQEAHQATGHGVGICVSPCRYCNEGVPHAPHVCANVVEGEPLPQAVREFVYRR